MGKTSRDPQFFIGIGLLAIAVLIILSQVFDLSFTNSSQNETVAPSSNNLNTSSNKEKNDPHHILDRHLKETQQNISLQKEELEFRKKIDDQRDFEGPGSRDHLEKNPIPLELNSGDTTEQLSQDLNKTRSQMKKPNSPEEYLQLEIFKEQEKQKYDEAYKEEYARQFIENARKDGWEIKLNKNFKVISVKPIKKSND